VIVGDNGLATFTTGVLTHIETTDSGIGGNETINAGDGNNVVLGGIGIDDITTGNGADVVVGDNGRRSLT